MEWPEGNECDLRRGLAFQSVHDGQQLVHKPLRLLVCIAATTDRLDHIIQQNEEVRNLVENGWVHLIALGPDGRQWQAANGRGPVAGCLKAHHCHSEQSSIL